jgi:uncharacterized YceG family protein
VTTRERPPEEAARPRRPRRRRGGPAWLVILVLAGLAVGVAALVHALNRGSGPTTAAAPPLVPVTFPEGLRRQDIAAILAERTHLSGAAYLSATGPGRRGERLAGAHRPTSLEGFLFPATYQIGTRTTVADLVNAQLRAFRVYTAGIDYRYARRHHLTPYDVLIIAALIEREVRVPSERPIVAGVIYNRLRDGMLLQIDATVLYALGSWTADLAGHAPLSSVDSPYNTYRHHGLPPGPISNPGAASIRAAAHPRRVPYLYYVARDDGSGRHYFASSLAGFEAAIARARLNARRGG